jgi:hypothetical protein
MNLSLHSMAARRPRGHECQLDARGLESSISPQAFDIFPSYRFHKIGEAIGREEAAISRLLRNARGC